ncbi:hypothetical protein K438DRAFT_1786602 [Mycena galopus ATCC 62051]|nr:hypothetical protein K438DRAFT_1786602 [Mycena galopus ATCC 62051]
MCMPLRSATMTLGFKWEPGILFHVEDSDEDAELPAGNLPHTQVYLDGYGKYLDAQHLLHEEHLLAHNIDVHASEERHRDAGLQMSMQELALREREIVLKEEELKLKVRDLTLREREFTLGELAAGDAPQ